MAQIAHERPAFAPVGFLERLLAYAIDFVILLVLGYGIAAVLGGERAGIHTYSRVTSNGVVEAHRFSFGSGGGSLFVSMLVGASYFIGSWCLFAATPGKLVLGYRIVHAGTGEAIGAGAAMLRYAGSLVSGFAVGLRYLWIIWDPGKQGWHDKIANTRVIRTR